MKDDTIIMYAKPIVLNMKNNILGKTYDRPSTLFVIKDELEVMKDKQNTDIGINVSVYSLLMKIVITIKLYNK